MKSADLLANHPPIAKTPKLLADGKKYNKVVIIYFLSADEKGDKIWHFIGRFYRPTVGGVNVIAFYKNMSMQYEVISKSGKNDIFRCKNVTFFLFLLKDRLWVLVRTASMRRF